jgi:hypothetical protein
MTNIPAAPQAITLGLLTINPPVGSAAITPFNISALGFRDPQSASAALYYSFSYSDVNNPNTLITLTGTLSTVPYTVQYFAAGSYIVYCTIYTGQGATRAIQNSLTANVNVPVIADNKANPVDCLALNATLDRLTADLTKKNNILVVQDIQLLLQFINFTLLSQVTNPQEFVANCPLLAAADQLKEICAANIDPAPYTIFSASLQIFLLETLKGIVSNSSLYTTISPTQLSEILNEITVNLPNTLSLTTACGGGSISTAQILAIVQSIIVQISTNTPLQDNNAQTIGQNIATGLSNLLSAGNCSLLVEITKVLEKLVTSTGSNTAVGSKAVEYTTPQLHILFKRLPLATLTSAGAVIPVLADNATGSSITFPIEALTALKSLQNDSIIDVVAIQHTAALDSCFGSNLNSGGASNIQSGSQSSQCAAGGRSSSGPG